MLGCIRPLATFAFALLLAACVENDVRRGNDALRIGDYDRAVTSFNKALDADPAHRDARYGLALSYYAIAEASERLRVPTFDLWSQAAKEFRILSNIDSSGKINANYSTCLFYLARAALKRDGSVDVMPMLNQCKDALLANGDVEASLYEKLMLTSTIAGMSIAHTSTTLPHGMSYDLTLHAGVPHGPAVGY